MLYVVINNDDGDDNDTYVVLVVDIMVVGDSVLLLSILHSRETEVCCRS